jgi:hypothetical protein
LKHPDGLEKHPKTLGIYKSATEDWDLKVTNQLGMFHFLQFGLVGSKVVTDWN